MVCLHITVQETAAQATISALMKQLSDCKEKHTQQLQEWEEQRTRYINALAANKVHAFSKQLLSEHAAVCAIRLCAP